MNILPSCILLFIIMSLINLHQISCKVFSSGCACKALKTAIYCTPTSSLLKAKKSSKYLIQKTTTNVSTRLFSSENDKVAEPTNFKDKIKYMWKNYGKIAIGTYISIYVTTLGSLFFALDFDVFNAASVGLDPQMAINKFCGIYQTITGSEALPNYIKENPRVGTFAIAWVMCKFTEPIRAVATVSIVPSIARVYNGFFPSNSVDNSDKSK